LKEASYAFDNSNHKRWKAGGDRNPGLRYTVKVAQRYIKDGIKEHQIRWFTDFRSHGKLILKQR
jgi:hypothetical protein